MPREKQTEAPAAAAPISAKRVMESCRHDFTRDEIRGLGVRLAGRVQDIVQLENNKALAVAEFAASIKGANNDAKELAGMIGAGYEMRAIECEVRYSVPQRGFKQIIRLDNNTVEREEPMTPDEMQIVLDFESSKSSVLDFESSKSSDKNVQ